MDVRCERCETVYELDDAQVGDRGLSVRCASCGHMFRVARRSTAPYGVVGQPQEPAPKARTPVPTQRGVPVLGGQATRPGSVSKGHPHVVITEDDRPFQLRLTGSHEIYRFREMSTLEQWILEQKVHPDDELSRNGQDWTPLHRMQNLVPIFLRAQSGGRPAAPPLDDLALSTTAPMRQPEVVRERGSGPKHMGDILPAAADDDALTGGMERLEVPRNRSMLRTLLVLLGIAAVGSWIFLRYQENREVSERRQMWIDRGQKSLALDTDESLADAATSFERALGVDEKSGDALLGRAEVHALRALYAQAELHRVSQGPFAERMRRESDRQLVAAKRNLDELRTNPPQGFQRVYSLVLVLAGGSQNDVAREVMRIKDPADQAWVRAVAAYRLDDKENALRLLSGATTLRAQALSALILFELGRRADARKVAEEILQQAPGHERARAIVDATAENTEGAAAPNAQEAALARAPSVTTQPPAPAPTPAAVGVGSTPVPTPAVSAQVASSAAAVVPAQHQALAPSATAAPASPSAAKTPSQQLSMAPSPVLTAADYNYLVGQAGKLAERGKVKEARLLYEKARAISPHGVEAITGLGYCDLDQERFLSAVDQFREALSIAPEYGDALIGLAESYKVRGDNKKALEYYERYQRSQPHGARASMVEKNIRELETKNPPEEKIQKNTPATSDTPSPEGIEEVTP